MNFYLYICRNYIRNNMTVVQKFKLTGDALRVAEKYYDTLSALNDLKLTHLEVQLLAFMAVNNGENFHEEFCSFSGTSVSTTHNMISRLKKRGLIVKQNRKNVVNPKIVLDFRKDVMLVVQLVHE